jgi:hypothetical protein
MKNLVILHEGNAKPTHDNHLIIQLIQHLNLDIQSIDFYPMGRKSNFFKLGSDPYLLLKSGVENKQIQKILFIIDADYVENDIKYGGYENTENKLNQIIKELGFEKISDIFIMCDPILKTGYLESFILSTIPEAQRKCIEDFLNCSEFKSKENHKAILNQIYKIAYPQSPYDFKHSHFDELKEKLRLLFENKGGH